RPGSPGPGLPRRPTRTPPLPTRPDRNGTRRRARGLEPRVRGARPRWGPASRHPCPLLRAPRAIATDGQRHRDQHSGGDPRGSPDPLPRPAGGGGDAHPPVRGGPVFHPPDGARSGHSGPGGRSDDARRPRPTGFPRMSRGLTVLLCVVAILAAAGAVVAGTNEALVLPEASVSVAAGGLLLVWVGALWGPGPAGGVSAAPARGGLKGGAGGSSGVGGVGARRRAGGPT